MISSLLAFLSSQAAGEGDFVTVQTIVGHGENYILVQPPNFAHAYLVKHEGDRLSLFCCEYAIDADDAKPESLPLDEWTANLGELTLVLDDSIAETLQAKHHPNSAENKMRCWIDEGINSHMQGVFHTRLLEWDWPAIVASAKANPQTTDDGEVEGIEYLGSILSLTPSGKLYTPFASSNTFAEEANVDSCWNAALEIVANDHGGYITGSEGDGCDVMFGISFDRDEDE